MARKEPGPGKAFLTVYVDREVVERLDRLASARDISRSKLVLELLLDGLQDSELTVAALTNPTISNAILGAMARPEVLRAMSTVMRDQVSDDQLELFQRAMATASTELTKHHERAARPKGTPGPRASRSGKQKKRGK